MDSAYIKALKEKYKNSLTKAKERERAKLNALYKDLALAIVQKSQKESEFKKICTDDELIAKTLLALLEIYLPQEPQDLAEKNAKQKKKDKE